MPALTWLRRRGVVVGGGVTLVLAAIAHAAAITVSTPQISGAQAYLSATTLLAAIAGSSTAVALDTADPVAEARAARRLRAPRAVTMVVLLALGALLFTLGRDGPDLTALRVHLFFATCSLLLTRVFGISVTAVTLAGYLGLCVFAGVPVGGEPAWWAVLLQPVEELGPVVAVAAAAAAVVVLVTWEPPLPTGYRRRPRAPW